MSPLYLFEFEILSQVAVSKWANSLIFAYVFQFCRLCNIFSCTCSLIPSICIEIGKFVCISFQFWFHPTFLVFVFLFQVSVSKYTITHAYKPYIDQVLPLAMKLHVSCFITCLCPWRCVLLCIRFPEVGPTLEPYLLTILPLN